MSWLFGKEAGEAAGEVVKAGLGSVSDFAENMKTIFTGELPPVEKAELALKQLKMVHEIAVSNSRHNSVFVAGWRPFIGWVGGFSLAFLVIHPLLCWAALILDIPTPPTIDKGVIIPIVMSMLGMGGLRSWDKKNDKG